MKTAKWNIKNNATEAEVWLYDEIGDDWSGNGISAKAFVEDLNRLPASVDAITVRVNSPGGNVWDGMAMYQALLRHRARVVVEIDACAASIASVIAMAGDTIRMANTSSMMIHDPYTFAAGNAQELRELAELLDHVAGNIVTAYARRDGVDEDAIRESMRAETWYTAAEAVAAGLVDECVEAPAAVAAKIPPGRFRNTPKALQGTQAESPKPQHARRRIEEARRVLTSKG